MATPHAKHDPIVYKTKRVLNDKGHELANIRLVFENGHFYVKGHIQNRDVQTFPMHKLSYAAARYEEYETRLNLLNRGSK